MMLNLIRNNQTSRIDPAVALRVQLHDSENIVSKAQREYDRLALAVVDGAATQKEADRAYEALSSANQRHSRTASTLEAAQTRAAEQRKQQARAELDANLTACVLLAEKRAQAADATEAAVKNLAEKIEAQRQAERALAVALPCNFTTAQRDGLYLEADELQASIRNEFDRLQMFGGPPAWRDHLPFAVKFHQSVDVMRSRRVDALERSA